MTQSFDTIHNCQAGRWVITNGIAPPIPLCEVCRQPVYEGHVNCSCSKNHPPNCDRPTYDQLVSMIMRLKKEAAK